MQGYFTDGKHSMKNSNKQIYIVTQKTKHDTRKLLLHLFKTSKYKEIHYNLG